MGIDIKARNGDSRSLSFLYWSWIRHVADEEGLPLPQSGSSSDSLDNDLTRKLASAIRTRAEKIRKGVAPRDASSYVKRMSEQWFPSKDEKEERGTEAVDFDDPDDLDETANFFDSSGGVILSYQS